MKFPLRTVLLAATALLLFVGTIHRARKAHVPTGLPVLLSHTCLWQESFNQIGDDRQIIVKKSDLKGVVINELHLDEAGLRRAFAQIYGTRAERLAWFEGDAGISYGDAVRVVSDMYQSGFHPAIVLLTPRDKMSHTANVAAVGECPFNR
jgi:biopolymer transport protein ExbD